ncbi:hypothetical protein AY601_1368 [Pedobacter cryoconitis]|uniref:Uncharacterized protein n=1 Tax=Pedobacter cryoconitis TaxID=188932 RepID=A0A127VAG9_9SPHI|nr:hypothetical protein AY601_1368 [Pedobacter cryoconitis]
MAYTTTIRKNTLINLFPFNTESCQIVAILINLDRKAYSPNVTKDLILPSPEFTFSK